MLILRYELVTYRYKSHSYNIFLKPQYMYINAFKLQDYQFNKDCEL